MPAAVADPKQSLDSEQISPATIAYHAVYGKIPNLHQSHMCQWGAQPYLVGPLSRLVGKPPFSPWLSRDILPLKKAANGPNSAISLTQTFDRISFCVYNSLYFGVQKAKKRGSGNNRVYRNLKWNSSCPARPQHRKTSHFLTFDRRTTSPVSVILSVSHSQRSNRVKISPVVPLRIFNQRMRLQCSMPKPVRTLKRN